MTDIKDEVDQLLNPQHYSTWMPPDKDPRTDSSDVYRDRIRNAVGDLVPVPRVSATERERRRGGYNVEVETPSLLAQLQQLREGNAAKVEMSTGRRTPSSRPPAGADAADLVVDITVGAAKHLRDALISLNRTAETTRRDRGVIVDLAPDAETSLRRLADLAADLDGELRKKIHKDLRGWRNTARLLLSVNAPMATLEIPCPVCNQQTLTVRSDATSDVFCGNPKCHNENGMPVRWPRSRWALLLADQGR